jgi:hypothetical protein
MAIMIQTAGRKRASAKYIKGPKAPANAITINAYRLKNPYLIVRGNGRSAIEETKKYLYENCKDKLESMIKIGKCAIENGLPIVVICQHGLHRSRAVAELIGDNFHCSKIYYVHREFPHNIKND